MRLACVIGLLILVEFVSAQQPDPAYVEAVKLQQTGDLEGAVREYRSFLELNPNHAGARSNLGAALAALGRYGEAIPEYEKALAALDHPGIRKNLALAYYKSARMPEAIAELQKLPHDVNNAVLLADCHFRMGDETRVIELLEPLSSQHPDNLALAYLLGTVLIRQGRVAEGQVLVDKILRHGDSAEAHLMLGTAHMRQAHFTDAIAEFERALELNPKVASANRLIGKCLMEVPDRPAAAKALAAELEINPHDFEANFFLGVILREDGRYAQALPYLEHALDLRPGDPRVRFQIGSLHLGAKNYEKARQVLTQLVADAPKFPEAHVALATVYYRLGQKDDAVRHRRISRELMVGDNKR